MSYAFPGELQQLVQSELARGGYASEDELLMVALKALGEREQVFQQLRAEVQSRIDSLDRGEGIELEDEQALREFADEIKAEGRRSLQANQIRP
jgi:Arc/MetJ-type ribon-helix-helix transcriptional regulator